MMIAVSVPLWRVPVLTYRGHLARLHLIAPPPNSKRAIDAKRDQSRIAGYFTARRLGMTPAKIIASRTRAEERSTARPA